MSKLQSTNYKLPLLVIVGPTSSGKTDLSIKIAKENEGDHARGGSAPYSGAEIISADSRQVYKGMNIGTGKVTKEEMQNIPHHLLDVVMPNTRFDVTKFVKKARKAIQDIHKRGKLPIIVGGTGFWIDALVYDMDFPDVKEDKKLRAELEKKSINELVKQLKELDPQRYETIDIKNKRRLVRALEIVLTTGKPVPKSLYLFHGREISTIYDVEWIGIDMPKERLHRRIRKRLIARIDQGMIDEVKRLHLPRSKGGYGVSWKRMEELGLEYRYISRMLRKQINMTEMIHQLEHAIMKYTKRQMTWFRRNKNIRWKL